MVGYLQVLTKLAVPVACYEPIIQCLQVLIGAGEPLRAGRIRILSTRVWYEAPVVARCAQVLHDGAIVELAEVSTHETLSPAQGEN
jgi:hypothetical protein